MSFVAFCQPRKIEVRKYLTNFEGCLFPRFDMVISSSFRKIETKIFNSDTCIVNLIKLGTIESVAHFLKWVIIRRSQTAETVISGHSTVLLDFVS